MTARCIGPADSGSLGGDSYWIHLRIRLGMSENGVYPQWNSNLVGIMISKTIGCRGTQHFSDKPIWTYFICRFRSFVTHLHGVWLRQRQFYILGSGVIFFNWLLTGRMGWFKKIYQIWPCCRLRLCLPILFKSFNYPQFFGASLL